MADQNSSFVGSIPENYDRYLGPITLEPYAVDLVKRVTVGEGKTVLELACGTGILTRPLRDRLPKNVKLVATDLNPAMLVYAEKKLGPDAGIEWKQADMLALPFPDQSFDVVVCQFGLMFVPDKQQAVREAYRVLAPHGVFLFNVWDSLEHNDFARIARNTTHSFLDNNLTNFYDVPWGYYDAPTIHELLEQAGFADIRVQRMSLDCIASSASVAAKGLVEGNPVVLALQERNVDVATVTDAIGRGIAERYGDHPARGKMQAFIWQAVRGS